MQTPVPVVDTVVELPADCNWLDEEPDSKSTPMLIRRSYVEIFDSMMSIANENSEIRGYVTLGNPGVGKSRYLSYCLWRFARDGKRVFFESVQQEGMWLFDPNGAVTHYFRVGELNPVFASKRDDYRLFDPYGDQPDEPKGGSAFTIIAASPNPIHYKGFRKRKGCKVRFFMPVWSKAELKLFRDATNTITDDELEYRLEMFGGIPRYVFTEEQEYLDTKAELDAAITEGCADSLEVIRAALGNMERGNKVSFKLIHYKVDTATYRTATVRYASPYVERELPLRAPANRLKLLGKVLSDVADVDVVMEGHIFEVFLHRAIPIGATFVSRCMEEVEESGEGEQDVEISTSKRKVKYFTDGDELTAALDGKCYARPNDSNYTAIDAVTWFDADIVFLQYTRSKKHGISMDQLTFYNDLLAVRKVTKSQEKIRFYFVVPAQEYETFERQSVVVPPRMRAAKLKSGKPNAYYVSDIDAKMKFVEDNVEQWVAMLKTD